MASEYDEYKKERQALIEAHKLKGESADGGAGLLFKDEERIVPHTFKEKWDNYWYHYKGMTFGIAFASLLVIAFACEMIFQTHYDTSLLFAAERPVDLVGETVSEKWGQFAVDLTENGKQDLDVMALQFDLENKFGGQDNPQIAQVSYTKLAAYLSSLDGYVFLLDEPTREYIKNQELIFKDLSEYVTDESKLTADKTGYKLSGTELGKMLEFSDTMLDTLSLYIIDPSTFQEGRINEKNQKHYDGDLQMLKNMIDFG